MWTYEAPRLASKEKERETSLGGFESVPEFNFVPASASLPHARSRLDLIVVLAELAQDLVYARDCRKPPRKCSISSMFY